MDDLSLRCRCGRVRGVITDVRADQLQRIVCYCDDCQAFARWIEASGGARYLDAHGGTDVVQVYPSQVKFTDGLERVKLMKLREKGLYRWFTECCKTPAGNMLGNHRSPFVGLPTAIVDAGEGRTLDALIGPPSAFIQGKFAPNGCPPHAHPSAPLSLLARSARFLLRGLVTGRYRPSAYFDGDSPRVLAQVLSPSERAALYPPTR